jgi:deazaflavin-dependent oxidoreductase (nitroreductase family)
MPGEFTRWMYRGGKPNALARFLNGLSAWVHAFGVWPNYLVTLEVTGRKSGRAISFPLVMIVVDGERYLVSMLGTDVAWVRNLRAAGERAVLKHGRSERVRLEDVPVERRAPLIKEYLRWAPGGRPHIPVSKDAELSEFERIAPQIPVFRVVTDAA